MLASLPSNLTPRGLTRDQAAAYCGVMPGTFANWVARGIMPPAIPGTTRWDRVALDRAFDRLSGIVTTPTPATALDQWLAKQNDARVA